MKSISVLLALFCFSLLTSCKKENVVDRTNDVVDSTNVISQVQLPDTIVITYYYGNLKQKSYKSVFTFPKSSLSNTFEVNSTDSNFSAGYFTADFKHNIVYSFDPVSKHLIHSTSRWQLGGIGPRSGEWDNSFYYSSSSNYPDSINIINYGQQGNPVPIQFNHLTYVAGLDYENSNYSYNPIEYLVNLNDTTNSIHVSESRVTSNLPLFFDAIKGYAPGVNDEIWYYFNSNNLCRRSVHQNGSIVVTAVHPFSADEQFEPSAEWRTGFNYDANSDAALKIMSLIAQNKDVLWNSIAENFSDVNLKRGVLYLSQMASSSYTDSIFTVSANSDYSLNTYSLYSARTTQNNFVKDTKGRITSILKEREGTLIEEYDFKYSK